MTPNTWQRVVIIALFLGVAVAMVVSGEKTFAATLIGVAGGLAIPPQPTGLALAPSMTVSKDKEDKPS